MRSAAIFSQNTLRENIQTLKKYAFIKKTLQNGDEITKLQGMYVQRQISKRLEQLSKNFPVVVLSGARQVGKSTLLKNLFAGRGDYVVFDPVTDIENARQDPQLFFANHRQEPLILDEIQYVPELVATIKRLVDQDKRPGRFVLTGSQQWEVMKSLADSLAGRAVFLDLEGFSLAELAQQPQQEHPWLQDWLDDPQGFVQQTHPPLQLTHSLYETLWRGFLPQATLLDLDLVPDFHAAYMRTYVERDVRLLAEVQDWHGFSRFVRLIAALSAQEINYSQLGREIGITPQTARRWLSLLMATFQWFSLPAFSQNSIKRVSSKAKGYIADTGFAAAAQHISSPTALGGHPLLGALFESAVVSELRKQIALIAVKPSLYHWRSAGGAEVDVVMERDGKIFPIEIKLNSQPSRKDCRGIRAFRESYAQLNIQPGLVLAPCAKMQQISSHDYALPWNCKAAS